MPFSFHHQFAVVYRKHFRDAVVPDHAFVHAGKKAVTGEVIHAVNIELPADELVKEFLGYGL